MSLTPRALVRPLALLIVVLATLLASFSISPSANAATRAEKVRASSRIALNQIGDPYKYGAAGPNRFDCSGLTYYAARRAGFSHMPRTSRAQARFTHRIRKSRLRRGDYMFFYNGGGVYHVGMFLRWNKAGRAVMLNAPYSGTRVRRDVAWTTSWFAGTLR